MTLLLAVPASIIRDGKRTKENHVSYYRMIRKGIEYDAEKAFQAAADAKHFSNPAGLIEIIQDCDRKFQHVTGDEADIEDIAGERGVLATNLGDRAVNFLKDDHRDKAAARIMEAVVRITRETNRSVAPAHRL